MAKVVGVDPGLSGALAMIDTITGEVRVIDMPVVVLSSKRVRVKKGKKAGQMRTKVRRAVCGKQVADWIEEVQPTHAVTEQVNAMPTDGKASAGIFMQSYGAVVGAIQAMNVRVQYVTPAVWKRHCGLIGKSKSASLTLARNRYTKAAPLLRLQKHDGRAEALLIAGYAAEKIVH